MKKKLLFPALVAMLVMAVMSFAACGDDTRTPQEAKIAHEFSACYAFTATSDTMEITENTTLEEYMQALKAAGKITFEGERGQYGFFITSMLGMSSRFVASTDNSYTSYDWMVYTTVTSIDGTIYSNDGITFAYDGITLYQSMNGVSATPCIEGETYAFVYAYNHMTW